VSPNGVTGGGQVGYNGQSGHIVYGVEADFDALRLNAAATSTATYPCCAPTAFTVTQTLKTSWMFTARPRIGYATGHALLYATAGLAMTNVNYQEVFTDTFAAARENGGVNQHKTGWAGGFGVEYQLPSKKHWSVKGEYLYTDFGRTTTTSNNLTGTPVGVFGTGNVFTHSLGLHANIIRGGVNYRW
jgi:outer membrane immunogenic protein